MFKVRRGSSEEIPLVQGKEQRLCFAGAAVKRHLGSILGQEGPLEKGMATYSSILALRIPWTGEPGRLQSMESQRVRHD